MLDVFSSTSFVVAEIGFLSDKISLEFLGVIALFFCKKNVIELKLLKPFFYIRVKHKTKIEICDRYYLYCR